MAKLFQRTGSLRPGMSMFDLSYEKKLTCDMGQLIPVMCDEVVPGDFFKIGNQAIIRMQPLVAPVLHEINMYVHYFFVPYRILDEDFEERITGGVDGDYTSPFPTWEPTLLPSPKNGVGSLWDYFGFPTDVDPDGAYPLDYPRSAYNLVYNEYYRDQNLQTEIALNQEDVLYRNWEKDYFTSSLPWQQRGTSPSFPIAGYAPVIAYPSLLPYTTITGATKPDLAAPAASPQTVVSDLSTATSFDIADLRLAFQIQKWMERNARSGARYTEFLEAHFGVSPRDERLQRPEYIGGSKSPVIISEVLQTSSTDATTPQGNLAGHGITVSDAYCGKYKATEYGLIIGIMSIMPRTSYQQGINRQWLRRTKYDFYFPEFANLSEQAIEKAEICALDTDVHNTAIFGYQGRYDELRIKHNMVCGLMRTTYDYWHLGRQFNPASPPALNEEFIKCIPRKDIYAVPSEPGIIVSFGNIIKAYRPIPLSAEPGLIDHN